MNKEDKQILLTCEIVIEANNITKRMKKWKPLRELMFPEEKKDV